MEERVEYIIDNEEEESVENLGNNIELNQGIHNINNIPEVHESEKTNNSEYVKSYSSSVKLYGISFQNNKHQMRVGLSSIETCNKNRLEIVDYDKYNDRLKRVAFEEVEFPCSKIMWSPSANNNSILATTSDILRLYKYNESSEKLSLACSLNKKQSQNYSEPLTSMDWNKENPSILGVCSIDTTCTIWDLTKNDVKTLLITNDKEVYDISFGRDENMFLTTGADGSVRLFDTRALDTCSVLFESQDNSPITRIAWNLNNSNFVAALGLDKNIVYIIDQRISSSPYSFLNYHSNVANGISWAPNSSSYICSVGDDKNAFIWDIQLISNKSEDPLMSFNAEYEIDNVSWSESNDEWIGITGSNNMQLLKVK